MRKLSFISSRSLISPRLVAGLAMLLAFGASPAGAATVHYWQFEDSPGFASDSVGALTLAPSAGTPSQATLPGAGRGSTFSDAVASTLESLEVDGNDVLAAPSFPVNDFTVESIVHADSLAGAFGHVIAGSADSQNNVGIAWILQLRNNQVMMLYCNGGACDVLSSGLGVSTGIDYFVAASVDLDGLSTTFYLQDLTNGGPLQSSTVAHSLSSLNAPANFAIGGAANANLAFVGLIDEVRISDHARSESELLINSPEPFASVPLLPSAMLPGIGAIFLATGVLAVRRRTVERR